MVVNDDADACEILARVLEAAGHQVSRAHAHDEAVGKATIGKPDLVVSDLPGAGAGVHLLEALRNRPEEPARSVRVIVIGAGDANAMFCWQSGADGFLVRPFDAVALQAEVTEVLARSDGQRQAHRVQALRRLR